jgi:hypothetical protein
VVQEEMEKVKMARFLKEIHDAVVEEGHNKLQKFKTAAHLPHRDVEGVLSLRNVNLNKLTPKEAKSLIHEIHKGATLDRHSLLTLLNASTALLKRDATLIDARGIEKVTVVGDLHGCLESLKKVLGLIGDIQDGQIVIFAGDFVDRGEQSIEVLSTLLLLKLSNPRKVFLLRGNHEDNMVSSVYGFLDEVKKKYGAGFERVWRTTSELFNALPIGVRTDTAFVVHGGIPNADLQLDDIAKISVNERCKISTVIDPRTPNEKLVSSNGELEK